MVNKKLKIFETSRRAPRRSTRGHLEVARRCSWDFSSESCRKSMHEVIVFEVGLTPVKTNKENISSLQPPEGKKMLLLGMPVLFPAKENAKTRREYLGSHTFGDALRAGNLNFKYFKRKYGKLCYIVACSFLNLVDRISIRDFS